MLAEKYGCKVYRSEKELLEDPDVDAVYVCTPNRMHCENAVAAFHSGKHVFCEKPLSVSVKELKEIYDASKAAGKILMTAHHLPFKPYNQKAKEILRSGKMGKIITLRNSIRHPGPDSWDTRHGKDTWFFRRELAVMGALGDVGVHSLDLIRFYTEEDIARVAAVGGTFDKRNSAGEKIEVEDSATCLFETESGIQGHIEVSWCNYGVPDMSTDILCTNGRMKIGMDREYAIVLEMRDGSREYVSVPDRTLSGLTDAFVTAVQDGKENRNLGASGCKSAAAAISCADSLKTRDWENVPNHLFP